MSYRNSVPPPPTWPGRKSSWSVFDSPMIELVIDPTLIGLSLDWKMRYHAPSVPDSQPVSSITVNPAGSLGHSPEGDGAMFETVTVTGVDVDELPNASRATAVSVCDPLDAEVVFHETAYGAVVSSAPRFTP